MRPGSRRGWTGPEKETNIIWTLVILNSWLIKSLFNSEIAVAFQARCKERGLWGLLSLPALTSVKEGSSVQESTPHSASESLYYLSLLVLRDWSYWHIYTACFFLEHSTWYSVGAQLMLVEWKEKKNWKTKRVSSLRAGKANKRKCKFCLDFDPGKKTRVACT